MSRGRSSSPIGNTKLQIIERRAIVARLYFEEGLTLQAISEQVYVSTEMVRKDKDWCLEQWRTKATDSVNVHKQRELDRLAMIEEQALSAWRRSIGDHETVTTKTTTVKTGESDGEIVELPGVEETRKVEEMDGDPRYMEIMLDCARQRRELLGLDSPKTFAGAGGGPLRFVIEGMAGASWIPKQAEEQPQV
jgi:hypothetical protein